MKHKTKYSRRFLSIMLAMLMLLAAAQPVSFVAAAGGDDPDPLFEDGIASAYWDGETIRLDFPQAKGDGGAVRYYADLIDLDVIDSAEVHLRKVIAGGISLQHETMASAAGGMLSAVIQPDAYQTADFVSGHRLNVAITAVNADGWRSQPIHAVVGDSVRVPQEASAPEATNIGWWKQFSCFAKADAENWIPAEQSAMDFHNDSLHGMNFDGVSAGDASYQAPGYVDESSASGKQGGRGYRFYVTNPKMSDSADIHMDGYGDQGKQGYWDNIYNYEKAEELWVWVDMTNVKFEKLAFQVRPNDGGIIEDDISWGESDETEVVFGKYEYSTVNYYEQMGNQEVDIQYVNQDGLWDTLTTQGGYLRDFGNYRGYLRIPVDKLAGKSYTGEYDGQPSNGNTLVEEEAVSREWKTLNQAKLRWIDWDPNGEPNYSRPALNYITSVGFTWEQATADSKEQSFYIDNIGFASSQQISGAGDSNIINVNYLPHTTDQAAAFADLVAENLPEDANSVNLSHKNVIEDLLAVSERTGVAAPQLLTQAKARLDELLKTAGADLPEYLAKAVQSLGESPDAAAIQPLYELYLTFTAEQIGQIGAAVEKKLLEAYNAAVKASYFPKQLGDLQFKPFNTFEENYGIGDQAYHLYDDSNSNGWDGKSSMWQMSPNYFGSDGKENASWETTRKLTAYSYNNSEDRRDDRYVPLRYTFGFGNTAVGNHGFMGSQSIDTRLNRRLEGGEGAQYEKYRIVFPYAGQETASWQGIEGCSIGDATDLMFYVNFSDVKDVRKLWISLVGDDGLTYSHDFRSGNLTYQRMADGAYSWSSQTVADDDGCLMQEMAGFKGFIRIPLSEFWADTGVPTEEPGGDRQLANTVKVKQIRIQYTASEAGSAQNVGSHLIFDQFGFVGAGDSTFEEQYYNPIATDAFTPTPAATVQAAFAALYTTARPIGEEEDIALLDADVDAIASAVRQYHSLSMADKAAIDEQYSIADILAVKANMETRVQAGSEVKGRLALYTAGAQANTAQVTKSFGSKAALPAGTSTGINQNFSEYRAYPAKYQRTVQTWWADRNLHAVYPNYQALDPEKSWANETPQELVLNEAGDAYILALTLPYMGAADGSDFKFVVDQTVLLTMGDGTEITATVTGDSIVNNGKQELKLAISIEEAEVQKAGTFDGSLQIGISMNPDTENGSQANQSNPNKVDEPEQYRKSYQIPLRLVCEAEWSITIPADTSITWDDEWTTMDGELRAEIQSIPSSAGVKVQLAENEGGYALKKEGSSHAIPYKVQAGEQGNPFRQHVFNRTNHTVPIELGISIPADDWAAVPIADKYKDTLTFTAQYVEAE